MQIISVLEYNFIFWHGLLDANNFYYRMSCCLSSYIHCLLFFLVNSQRYVAKLLPSFENFVILNDTYGSHLIRQNCSCTAYASTKISGAPFPNFGQDLYVRLAVADLGTCLPAYVSE